MVLGILTPGFSFEKSSLKVRFLFVFCSLDVRWEFVRVRKTGDFIRSEFVKQAILFVESSFDVRSMFVRYSLKVRSIFVRTKKSPPKSIRRGDDSQFKTDKTILRQSIAPPPRKNKSSKVNLEITGGAA